MSLLLCKNQASGCAPVRFQVRSRQCNSFVPVEIQAVRGEWVVEREVGNVRKKCS